MLRNNLLTIPQSHARGSDSFRNPPRYPDMDTNILRTPLPQISACICLPAYYPSPHKQCHISAQRTIQMDADF